jgi:hypothetical protein
MGDDTAEEVEEERTRDTLVNQEKVDRGFHCITFHAHRVL